MVQWIYNPDTLLYERVDEPWWRRPLRIVCLVLGVAAVVVVNLWLYIFVLGFDLPKTAMLKKTNSMWQSRIEIFNRQLDFYDQTLSGLETRDDEVYRAIYGLDAVSGRSGFGNKEFYDNLESEGASLQLRRTIRRLELMSVRATVESASLDEVHDISSHSGDMLSCVPSIPPLCPDRAIIHLSSSYGYRRDPVYGGGEFHQGQDFSARKGYPVYATGDGVVELADFKFRGYGNELVIDHGYGYKTRYAHLNTIEVAEGMKVSRGERVGTVGNSGKSTGAHLHYEVIYRDRRMNPLNYMDIDIPVKEYNSMVLTRKDESPYDKKRSTGELLRRRRDSYE